MILFLKFSNDQVSHELVRRLSFEIRSRLSARHVPALILSTPDIPYTTTGKKVEVAVKQILHGEEVKNKSALANPDSLEFYKNIHLP